MGCPNISIYDNDTVEEHNIASQFFKQNQLGRQKTDSLLSNIKEQTGIILNAKINIDEEQITEGLIIIAIDSIEERIRLANIYKDRNIYIIDGGMGGLQLEIYCCPSTTYVATLINSDYISREPCTGRAICFNCAVIAGLISNFVRQFSKKELIDVAYKSMVFSNADLMVANDFKDIYGKHKAFIVDKNKNIIECKGKEIITQKLFNKIKELL